MKKPPPGGPPGPQPPTQQPVAAGAPPSPLPPRSPYGGRPSQYRPPPPKGPSEGGLNGGGQQGFPSSGFTRRPMRPPAQQQQQHQQQQPQHGGGNGFPVDGRRLSARSSVGSASNASGYQSPNVQQRNAGPFSYGEPTYGQGLPTTLYGPYSTVGALQQQGGWYAQHSQGAPLRYSPPEGPMPPSGVADSTVSPTHSSSNMSATGTSPATSQHLTFPYNPYNQNPYAVSVSPHGYYLPQGVLYPSPSGPPSTIDPSSQPSSPAFGASSQSSSSPHTIQSQHGQTWMYVPVGYYPQPGAYSFPSAPTSSDGSFSSQGGQGPLQMYGSAPNAAPVHYPQPPPPPPSQGAHYNSQQHPHQQHLHQQHQRIPPHVPQKPQPMQHLQPGRPGPPLAPSPSSIPQSPFSAPLAPLPPALSQPRVASQPDTPILPSPHAHGNSPIPVRKAWHPAPPPQRSEWVMWCGNVPSDATQEELWAFFTGPLSKAAPSSTASAGAKDVGQPALDGSCDDVASVFLIARSSCCFVNYRSQEALDIAIARFNGLPIRPLEGPRAPRLVCRVRRKEDDLKAGVGGQRGRGVHKDWVKERQAQAAANVATLSPAAELTQGEGGTTRREDAGTPSGLTAASATTPQSHQGSTISSHSTDSSFLSRYFPIRYFILKSLTQVDLDTSIKSGMWATQPHNEPVLDQAYRTSKEVILIFGANKTGEFFGYAKMAGPIKKGVSRLSWASRSSGQTFSPTNSSSALSPTGSTHPIRSAPDPIAEGPEDEQADPQRASTHPNLTAPLKPSFFRSTTSQSSFKTAVLQDSPGEMFPGASSALQFQPATTSSLRAHAPIGIETERATTPRNSAPGVLESQQKELVQNAVRRMSHGGGEDVDLGKPLTKTETAAIINEVGKASVQGAVAADRSTPSPPKFAIHNGSPLEPLELPSRDEDGIKRIDHAPQATSANSQIGGSAGSGPSATSFASSSAGVGSSRSGYFPNLHLPATPDAGNALALENTVATEASNAPPADGETWGTPFTVEWLQTQRLPFFKVKHLRNPWNSNREIKVSRDGTEVEPDIGRQLLDIWNSPTSPAQETVASPDPGSSASPSTFSYAGVSKSKPVAPSEVLGLGLSTPPLQSSAA